MKPRIISLLLLLTASCTPLAPPPTSATTAPVTPIDLTEPATQDALGSPPFSPVGWQRFAGPFNIVGDDELPDANQLVLIEAALAETPVELFSEPRTLVRTSLVPTNLDPTRTLAVAVGPDIYLLDPVFAIDGSTSLLNLTYAITHELAHTQQWYALDDDYVRSALDGDVERVDLVKGSALVRSFAADTGWQFTSDGSWMLSDESVTASAYARTNPAEDMAESIAWAAVGRTDWIDDARQVWIEEWAGVSLDQLANDMPWSPAGSEERTSPDPIYDEAAVAQLSGALSATHIEPLYFSLADIGDPADFADQIVARLTARGMTGQLQLSTDERLPRYTGVFFRSDGTAYWVEFWDFRGTELGDAPVLTYVLIRP